ncbi:MAG: family 20 glycosylhydrolase, partial [Bacteroidaceae bacterium]|nr:family 20 glycosylhydrolase [Bacteroidaceae bacterium]
MKYPYRGLSLDVSRHFFDVDEIKKLLRLMNRLE